MRTSENIDQLATALAAAQGEFTNPERNRDVEVKMKSGGTYTFAYATFDAIIEMVRPPLAKHGLMITQPCSLVEHCAIVTTRLAHKSGQWIEDEISWGVLENDGPQQLGSILTYLKRYSLVGMLGIASEEDDDGNAASGNQAESKPRAKLPACPKCGESKGVIVGKEEYGGGLVCFAKKGGCGHKWNPESDLPDIKPPKKAEPAKEPPSDPYERAVHFIDGTTELAALSSLVTRCINHETLDAAQKQTLLERCARKAPTIKETHDGERATVLHQIVQGTEAVNV